MKTQKLIRCKACSQEISPKAKTCPHCGEPVKKKGSGGCALLLLLFLFAGLGFLYVVGQNSSSTSTTTDPRTAAIQKQFNAWDGSHIATVKAVKEKMNDPSSFKHVKTTYIDKTDSLIIKMVFRGTNKLGAVVTQTAIATVDAQGIVQTVEFFEGAQ